MDHAEEPALAKCRLLGVVAPRAWAQARDSAVARR